MNRTTLHQSLFRKPATRVTSVALLLLLSGILVLGGVANQALAQDGTPTDAVASEGDTGIENVAPEPTATPPQEQPAEPEQQPPATLDVADVPDAASGDKQPEANSPPGEAESTAPSPALSYKVPDSPDCRLDPEAEQAVRSGGFVEYLCADSVQLHAERLNGSKVTIARTVHAFADGIWNIQLADAPSTLPQSELIWTQPSPGDVSIVLTAQSTPGGELEDTEVDLTFRVRLHRPVCSLAAPELRFERNTTVETSGVAAQLEGPIPTDSARLSPELAPIPEPSVMFTGPIDFGVISVDSTGPSANRLPGTLTLQLTDLNKTCGAWSVALSSGGLLDVTGAPLEGSTLSVTSVNGESQDDVCELTARCLLPAVTESPAATDALIFTVGLELQLPENANPGQFQASLSAELVRVEGS